MPNTLSLDEKLRLLLHRPQAFETWLRDHPGPVVGGTGAPRACPLANFLRSRLNLAEGQDVRVFSQHTTVLYAWRSGQHGTYYTTLAASSLPPWSRRFVGAIDASGKDKAGMGMALTVSRGEALRQLAAVVAPEGAGARHIKEMAPTPQ